MSLSRVVSCTPARLVVLSLVVVFLPGCEGCNPQPKVEQEAKKTNYGAELPEGMVGLRLCSPEEYPDFGPGYLDQYNLARAVDYSLYYMSLPSSKRFYPYNSKPPISHEQALATLRAFRQILDDCASRKISSPEQFNQVIAEKFLVYKSIGAPKPEGEGFTEEVLFTGYYTPIYNGSLTPSAEYKYPLYKRPPELKSDPVTGETAPYLTRQEIEGGALAGKGLELVYLPTRFDAYVITVQGSAKIKLPDGRIYEIGFAGYNGRDYASPGMAMIEAGVLTKEELNLKRLRQYFTDHPEDMDKYLNVNPRYVFFTETKGGPFGSLGVPVTTKRTIATDKRKVYPAAMPSFLMVDIPTGIGDQVGPYRGFMMDQDTGGAIRAAGRCDIYMGEGEAAEQLAGHQLHVGELYYLALKPELMSQYSTPMPAERKTGPAQPAGGGAPQPLSGGRGMGGAIDAAGPTTDHLPVKDSKGPPPPRGWPTPKP